ncbi:MAG: V-type ATPase subunit [Candidatus Nanohaloarchaea archaeon]
MSEYPYMYARISAKRAKLLDSQDYEKLLKMQPNEIARYLGEREYREDIDELGARHEGVELVELALNRNLSRVFTHMCKIAPEPLEKVIKAYLRKYDLMSIKRLLRWKRSDEDNDIEDLLIPVGSLTFDELERMADMEFGQILDEIRFPDSEIDYQGYVEGKQDLAEIEGALDQAYYDELDLLAEKVDSPRFSRFIEDELENENLRTALRLKKYDFDPGEIRQYLATRNGSKLVEEVINADDIEDAMQLVIDSGKAGEVDDGMLEDLEHAMDAKRLQEALTMLHTEPLGTTSILGYVVAKIIEVKNLRMLIRAKETGIQNLETIRRNLVYS